MKKQENTLHSAKTRFRSAGYLLGLFYRVKHMKHVSATQGSPPLWKEVMDGRDLNYILGTSRGQCYYYDKLIFYFPNSYFLIYTTGILSSVHLKCYGGVANVWMYTLIFNFPSLRIENIGSKLLKWFHNNKSEFILLFNCDRNKKKSDYNIYSHVFSKISLRILFHQA